MNITPSKPIGLGIRGGFTLIDLIVVTAVIAILAGLILPAMATIKAAAQGLLCLNNKKQLIIAFSTYASDNNGTFIGNFHGGQAQNPDGMSATEKATAPWMVGWLDWATARANTNTLYLTNSKYGRLSPYFGSNRRVVKCPSDQYLSASQQAAGWTERVRSVSANVAVGNGNAEAGSWDPYYTHVRKYSEMVKPAPGDVWVYTDEHPDSINDPAFFNPSANQWIDVPASYHDGAGSFAFADGRAELHQWQASAKGVKITTLGLVTVPPQGSNDADILWLRNPASHK